MISYFAFGSNMNPSRIKKRLGRIPESCGGMLKDYSLCFNKINDRKTGAGYANIVPVENVNVYGVLYQVSEDELSKIDCCEGINDGHYSRKDVAVILNSGKNVSAVTYVACSKRIAENLLPEQEYLNHLLAGREYLPDEYYNYLLSHKTID